MFTIPAPACTGATRRRRIPLLKFKTLTAGSSFFAAPNGCSDAIAPGGYMRMQSDSENTAPPRIRLTRSADYCNYRTSSNLCWRYRLSKIGVGLRSSEWLVREANARRRRRWLGARRAWGQRHQKSRTLCRPQRIFPLHPIVLFLSQRFDPCMEKKSPPTMWRFIYLFIYLKGLQGVQCLSASLHPTAPSFRGGADESTRSADAHRRLLSGVQSSPQHSGLS